MNKTVISLLVITGAVLTFLLVQASKTGTALVMLPTEVLAAEPSQNLSRIRVAGRVSADEIQYQMEPTARLSFRVENPGGKEKGGATIPVVYNGLKPDMFAAGRDVIIDGEFKSGVLVASNLLTQCPSKYEPPSPEKKYAVPER